MFQGLMNFASLLKNASSIQERMKTIQQDLAKISVEGQAGAGAVKATANGHLKLTALSIEPSLATGSDRELLEDLVLAAVNQAMEKAREAAAQQVSQAAGGFDIPGFSDAISKMGGDPGK